MNQTYLSAAINAKQNLSEIFNQSRFDYYKTELARNYDGLLSYQYQFKQMSMLHTSDLGLDQNPTLFQSVNLSLTSAKGTTYY